ncbi:hypothetical protein RAS12_06820 [Achromobacter seleniivolatilans]|uniref:Uncharacterized protein n=1 Tax=Achromobacter seleniivolatilans TaxID=3047478 RepID=A0ABY9M5U3_9BURK|nr:hypothetical protein [Achromobacter sp. R39]WMD22080.1 hypothetical protein RAS12_06820 [Achromobacter sp. R39]
MTAATIRPLADAIFAKPGAQVLEAYSALDCEPMQFASADALAAFIEEKIAAARGMAYFYVVYPDMLGRACRKTIHLKPDAVPGHTLRYTWEGWGLISVQVQAAGIRISANSETRANTWVPQYPEFDPPDTWNWRAVGSHVRRLQRVVKKSADTKNID